MVMIILLSLHPLGMGRAHVSVSPKCRRRCQTVQMQVRFLQARAEPELMIFDFEPVRWLQHIYIIEKKWGLPKLK